MVFQQAGEAVARASRQCFWRGLTHRRVGGQQTLAMWPSRLMTKSKDRAREFGGMEGRVLRTQEASS